MYEYIADDLGYRVTKDRAFQVEDNATKEGRWLLIVNSYHELRWYLIEPKNWENQSKEVLRIHKESNDKGQIISEQICGVLKFSKKQRNTARISALASEMGQIKRIMAIFYTKS